MSHPKLEDAVKTLRQQYGARNPSSLRAFEDAKRSLPGGGTRSSIFIQPFPLVIASGHGTCLTDLDGHTYRDFVSDFTSGLYGKTNVILRDAIVGAIDNGMQLGGHTPAEGRLASLICDRFPAMDLVRFANSGTEANMIAICTAMRYTGCSKIVVFEGGYHGSLLSHFRMDELNAGPSSALTAPFNFVVCPYNDLEQTREKIVHSTGDVAAILVEPMLGAGGCIPGEPSFLRGLRELATEVGALLIFDEVQTARLDMGGRQKLLDIEPDLTTLGKFFGGGFAFGAFGGKREVMKMFDMTQPGAISHGGTFNNSPCTMVAGVTALEQLVTESALTTLNALGDNMRESLNQGFSAHSLPFIREY
ncbi:hypothetical protein EHS25_003632 [Saitozyma podzolica]|uniref:Glutamate-1-semialdehyde 2,1-aminomutase n=1 Tax=Saitozyma podzolica TaxID=1890683 RepID=A0A427Y7T3_9TREE|nr:hypothetical protein EHS25_003632 [Saitozyma podzolica]